MEISVSKVVGRVGQEMWAQVHDFEKGGQRLLAVLSLRSDLEAGREALSRFHELYFGAEGDKPVEILRHALGAMEEEFGEIEIAAVVIYGKAIYVGATGGGKIWVRKGSGKEGWLVDSNPKINVFSGWMEDGDKIVFGNSFFWESVTMGAIKVALGDAEGAEMLAAMVHGNEKGRGAVGAIVAIGHDKPQASSPPTSHRASPGKQTILEKWLPKRGTVYINYENKQKSRKRMTYLGVGFLVVLLGLVGGGQIKQRREEADRSGFNQRVEVAKYKYDEARAIVGLNPSRSKQLLSEVSEEIKSLGEFKRAEKDVRWKEMNAGMGEVLGAASGIKKVDIEMVLDLGLVREGMTGGQIRLLDDKLWILDTVDARLVKVDPAKKSGEVVAGKEVLGAAKLLAVYPGKATIHSDKGIVECSVLSAQCSVAVKFDDGWGEIRDMGMFAGNVYLLQEEGILRFQAAESGYGEGKKWLDSELTGAGNMAIDGFVWVMGKDGVISKYARGVKENWQMTGLDKAFGSGVWLDTNEDSEKLYILDRINQRVVVVKKTGEYESQYVGEKIALASKIAVDEKGGKIYLLAGSMIYSVKP